MAKSWESPNGQWKIYGIKKIPENSLYYQEGRRAMATVESQHDIVYVYLSNYGKLQNDRWYRFPKYVEKKAIALMSE